MHVVDLRKRKFEDVFRTERPDALVHHAFVRHFRGSSRVRHEVNVLGTKRVLEYAIAYGVKRIVVGNPRTVPAGQYAEQALRALGLWDRLKPRLVFAENVRQALEYVARGEVERALQDAGLKTADNSLQFSLRDQSAYSGGVAFSPIIGATSSTFLPSPARSMP